VTKTINIHPINLYNILIIFVVAKNRKEESANKNTTFTLMIFLVTFLLQNGGSGG